MDRLEVLGVVREVEVVVVVVGNGCDVVDGTCDCSVGNCKLSGKSGDGDSGTRGVHGGEISIELSWAILMLAMWLGIILVAVVLVVVAAVVVDGNGIPVAN
jgi:hypothetical protein